LHVGETKAGDNLHVVHYKMPVRDTYNKMLRIFFLSALFSFVYFSALAQKKNDFAVIAYYAGNDITQVDSFSVEKLTHIIFSFCHLKGNRLNVDNAGDSAMISKMVSLKKRNSDLKVILSLGGWGGCETCSDVFSTAEGRQEFSESVKELSEYFGSDGLDLDWEYPTIEGYPNHKYQPADKQNFTELVTQLRKTLGWRYEISFAAGGFNQYIENAVDWQKVVPQVNYINLMTYDLVNGYSKLTGHHTPLYSTDQQTESVDNAVQKLLGKKIPAGKIVIGAAFYGRVWDSVPDINHGLYQQGTFLKSVSYKNFPVQLSADSGFTYHWDEKAGAPYLYNPKQHLFATFDDLRSMALKTKYVKKQHLGGIMFWQLTGDVYSEGLLDAIDKVRHPSATKQ
jgi:chitinase